MAVAFTQTANPAGVSATGNVATYSAQSIGTAHPDRIVAVLVGTEIANGTIDICTIDYGTGAQIMNAGDLGNFGNVYARAFYLNVPTGTTATIAVTFGANPSSTQNHIAVYNVSDAVYSSKGSDGSTDMDANDRLTTGSVTIATGGGFLAVAAGAADNVSKTWANATEDIDTDAGNFQFTTASSTSAGTTTITCTGGTNQEDGALSWLIFTDLAPSSSVSPSSSLSPSASFSPSVSPSASLSPSISPSASFSPSLSPSLSPSTPLAIALPRRVLIGPFYGPLKGSVQ